MKEFSASDVIHNKKTKPALLEWMANKFGVKYAHSFKDQFIHWSIWDGSLSISLDLRDEAQKVLFDAIPAKHKGCKQKRTGKLVNERTIYFDLNEEFKIEY